MMKRALSLIALTPALALAGGMHEGSMHEGTVWQVIFWPGNRVEKRSTRFESSRTLPGQAYCASICNMSSANVTGLWPGRVCLAA